MAPPSDFLGPLELLVLQPTPFCNINCSYCYLPDRQSTRRMSLETLDRTFAWVFASGLVSEPFTLLWHAGEPTVVPVPFYEEAIRLLEKHNRTGVPVYQSFQTNATLLDTRWCDFIQRHGINVGVSVDGPEFLHDNCRRTRQGKGTLQRVLAGIQLLHEHEIPFYVITVLTAESLNNADELFDFYVEHGITQVCFNVEEIEGPNTSSSLSGAGVKERFRRFLERFLVLACAAEPPLAVREFDTSAAAIRGVRYGPGTRTQENKPWAIVNVDCDGNFSTYSPELLGLSSPRYGSFALGNVATDSLAEVIASERFRKLEADIGRGVELCRQSCPYFTFCGGGPPVNKYFENGTFASTETLFCRLHKQVCLDVALDRLEQQQRPSLEDDKENTRRAASRERPETQPGELYRFRLPKHLCSAWWRLVERAGARARNSIVHSKAPVTGEGCLPGFDKFVADVADFMAFKDLCVPHGAVFELVASSQGLRYMARDIGTSSSTPRLWGGINLGAEPSSLVFNDLSAVDLPAPSPMQITVEPGEGFRLPTLGILVDGGPEAKIEPDVLLLISTTT